jgi:hypothetical protein
MVAECSVVQIDMCRLRNAAINSTGDHKFDVNGTWTAAVRLSSIYPGDD